MKKFMKLLSVAALAITSFATVANAAITEDVYKPEFVIEVDSISDGYALVSVSVEVDTDLGVAKSGPKYTGVGLTSAEVRFDFDTDIFNPEDIIGDPIVGSMDKNPEEGFYYAQFSWANGISNVLGTTDKKVKLGTFWAAPNADYASMTAEELNALPFATVTTEIVELGRWQSAAAGTYDITRFRSDGNGEFDCSSRVGTEPVTPPTPPAPTASVAISAAKKTTDAAWIAEKGNTMFWGVDFANGGFNGTAVAKIFSDAKERELTIATPAGAEINGEASFGVFVIVGDSTDAIGLTITSGDVTATAAPVAYADAE